MFGRLLIIIFMSIPLLTFAEQKLTTNDIEQHPPHEHGAATLTLAGDTNSFEIALESPADNIFGFEHMASTPEEKTKISQAVSLLKDDNKLFSINKEAQCKLTQVSIKSPQLEATKKAPTQQHVHNDVDASWSYACKSGSKLTQVTPHFFEAFSGGFKKLKVEWLTATGASSKILSQDEAINF